MKRLALSFISILFLASCSGGGGGSSSAEDQVFGDWYWEAPGSSSTTARGLVAKLEANGNASFAFVYAYSDGTNAVAYTRKSIGTWTRNGEEFTIKYSYETCDPVGQEVLNIKVVDGKLMISGSGNTMTLARPTGKSTIQTMASIEDKNCNIIGRLERANARLPASAHKSVFARAK